MHLIRSVQILKSATTVHTAVRSLASASDPIQKLFLEKINEYAGKAKKSSDGLVDSNPKLVKAFNDEMARVANLYGVKDGKNIADLGLNFPDTTELDSINLRK